MYNIDESWAEMKKLAIFDLDGTLLDSIEDIARAANKALADNGLAVHNIGEYKKMVGNGVKVLIDKAVPQHLRGTDTYNNVFKKYMEEYEVICNTSSTMFEGTRPLLEKLKEKGVIVAVVTNKPDKLSKAVIYNTLPHSLVDEVYGYREDLPAKPDPTVVNLIMKKYNAKKEETIFIGDSNVDIFTGKNAGVTSVGVTWGFRDVSELKDAGADFITNSFDELLQIIL